MKFFNVFLFLSLFISLPVQANYSTMDTANLLERGKTRFHVNTHLSQSERTTHRLNLNSHIDTGLTSNSGLRGTLGLNSTDFHVGALYKWAPIPDIKGQPAIGFLTGVTYSVLEEANEVRLQFQPIISKSLDVVNLGKVTPYSALPISLRSRGDEEIDLPIQVTFGMEIKPLEWKNISVMTEMSINIQNSFNYFGFGLNLPLNVNANF